MTSPIEIIKEWIKTEVKRCDRTDFHRFRHLGEFKGVLNVAETIGKQKYTAIRNKIGEEYKADKINPHEYLKFLSIVEDAEEE